jgi:enoyl-CoA hydratase/3-hydroxyacyl-CoA dehydrogenase
MSSTPQASSLVAFETVDGIAKLTINRPDALNALNPAVVFQLHQAVRQAMADGEVHGLLLTGAGRAFVSGADVKFFLRNIEAGDLGRIVRFSEASHDLFNAIDRAPKPVVACVHGLALGGGLELALACDRIIVAAHTSLGFPEAGLGLYPGLGGTQRTPRKIGPGLAKWLLYTARTLTAKEALEIGLIEQVVPESELESAARQAIAAGLPPVIIPPRAEHYAVLEAFFDAQRVDDLLAGRADPQGHPALVRAVRRVRTMAPLALHFVEQFIDEGMPRSLADALRLEIDHSEALFRTADAYAGLRSLGKTQPVFQGR